jgi:hypothetical protein
MASKHPARPSTQRFLDIAEIRDDMVVLKDGSVRSVILVSSINFALKSADEQQGIIQGYMQFLNGLDFPIQVVVQSRNMNIADYISRMRAQERELQNELLRTHINDYIQFIQQLVDGGEIMSKHFYVVVPLQPGAGMKKTFWARLREAVSPIVHTTLSRKEMDWRADELNQRTSHVQGGLSSMGVSGVRLDTQGLIELYYHAYNLETASVQPLQSTADMQVETQYGF